MGIRLARRVRLGLGRSNRDVHSSLPACVLVEGDDHPLHGGYAVQALDQWCARQRRSHEEQHRDMVLRHDRHCAFPPSWGEYGGVRGAAVLLHRKSSVPICEDSVSGSHGGRDGGGRGQAGRSEYVTWLGCKGGEPREVPDGLDR
jgi:hypothetical protein